MVICEWNEKDGWSEPELKPYGPLSLDPATAVFHYGQEIFEGMKAYRQPDGGISLFRPDANAKRFNKIQCFTQTLYRRSGFLLKT